MKASKAVLHLAAVLRNVSLGRDVQSSAPWLPAKLGLLYAELGTESREVHSSAFSWVKSLSLFAKLVPAAPTVWGQRGKGWPWLGFGVQRWVGVLLALSSLPPQREDALTPQRPATSPWLSPGSLCGLQQDVDPREVSASLAVK